MRYYTILIKDFASGKVIKSWSSKDTAGNTLSGALNIEIDAPVFTLDIPMGAAYLRIWGISLKDIGQASDYNFQTIEVYAGMAKGLPLANPQQAGLIFAGTIQQCFGNWQAKTMTLDFVVNPPWGTPGNPINLTMNWKKGTPLAQAIQQTMQTAFPTYPPPVININPNLVLSHDEPVAYATLTQFAQYIQQVSADITGNAVRITIKSNQINIYDDTYKPNPIEISFFDLVGQPTWIAFNQVQFKAIMRADLDVGDYIKLPPNQATTTAQSFSQYRDSSVFQGAFQISRVRHIGNFRQPLADAWVTVVDCYT